MNKLIRVEWVSDRSLFDCLLSSWMLRHPWAKRKSILDHLRKSLSTLGVLVEIEYNPSLFEEFFVHQGGLTNDFVLNCLHFQDSCKQNVIEDRVNQMLETFVKNLSVDELKKFLKFVTGTSEVGRWVQCFSQQILKLYEWQRLLPCARPPGHSEVLR